MSFAKGGILSYNEPMEKTWTAKHISISINVTKAIAYEFVSDLRNLSKWADGIDESMKITFAPKNNFGVLDHDVTLSSGETFYNPMRVIENGSGSELIFTLFKTGATTEVDFEKDAAQILTDFSRLKVLLEK